MELSQNKTFYARCLLKCLPSRVLNKWKNNILAVDFLASTDNIYDKDNTKSVY